MPVWLGTKFWAIITLVITVSCDSQRFKTFHPPSQLESSNVFVEHNPKDFSNLWICIDVYIFNYV